MNMNEPKNNPDANKGQPPMQVRSYRITHEDCMLAALSGLAAVPGVYTAPAPEAMHRRAMDLADMTWQRILAARK